MSAPQTKLEDLIDLAKEPSSARRRELLRQVSDLFFAGMDGHGAGELELFDGVLSKLADDMEVEVRAELAGRFADHARPPSRLMRRLAGDEIGVAEPILTRSPFLTQDDLLQVVRTRDQAHLRAVSGRRDLSTAVSDVIVARGDDLTLGVLLRNEEAPLSRQASETVIDRAVRNPDLHDAVVDRKSLPVDLLNEMYFVVEARLRERITERNAGLDPVALEQALERGRKRLASRDGALPSDFVEAEAHIRHLRRAGPITPSQLAGFLRHGARTRFLVALAELSEIDFHTARRIVERQELDALAIVCKAAGFDRALFLTFAVLILDPGEAMKRAEAYGRLYADLPKDAALRTLRFWRMRRQTGDIAAA